MSQPTVKFIDELVPEFTKLMETKYYTTPNDTLDIISTTISEYKKNTIINEFKKYFNIQLKAHKIAELVAEHTKIISEATSELQNDLPEGSKLASISNEKLIRMLKIELQFEIKRNPNIYTATVIRDAIRAVKANNPILLENTLTNVISKSNFNRINDYISDSCSTY